MTTQQSLAVIRLVIVIAALVVIIRNRCAPANLIYSTPYITVLIHAILYLVSYLILSYLGRVNPVYFNIWAAGLQIQVYGTILIVEIYRYRRQKARAIGEKLNAELILPIVIALIAATPGALALWRQSRLDTVQVPQSAINEGITASQAAATIIRQYSDEIQSVRKELHDVRGQIDGLEMQLETKNDEIKRMLGEVTNRDRKLAEWAHGIEILCAQVIRLKEQPAWRPANTGELKLGG